MSIMARRDFDEKMADMRGYYECLPAESKATLRASLEKLQTVTGDILQHGRLLVRILQEIEYENEEGEQVSVAREYCPRLLLAAIKAWDAGEPYAPPGSATVYG